MLFEVYEYLASAIAKEKKMTGWRGVFLILGQEVDYCSILEG